MSSGFQPSAVQESGGGAQGWRTGRKEGLECESWRRISCRQDRAPQFEERQGAGLDAAGMGNLEGIGPRRKVEMAFGAGLQPQLGRGYARLGITLRVVERKLVSEAPEEDAQSQRQQRDRREIDEGSGASGRAARSIHRGWRWRRRVRCWTAGRQRSCLSLCLQKQRGSESILTRFKRFRWKFTGNVASFRRAEPRKAIIGAEASRAKDQMLGDFCEEGQRRIGGRGRNRTYNLSVKSRMLCQLSYASIA